jgi:hypothetical protein
MKYAPLESPIANAPTYSIGRVAAVAVNAAATVRTPPVPRTTWWRGTRVRR